MDVDVKVTNSDLDSRFISFIFQWRWVIVVSSWVIFAISISFGIGAFFSLPSDGFYPPNSEGFKVNRYLTRSLAPPEYGLAVICQGANGLTVNSPSFTSNYKLVKEGIATLPKVIALISHDTVPFDDRLTSDDHTKRLILGTIKGGSGVYTNDQLRAAATQFLPPSAAPDFSVLLGGEVLIKQDITIEVLAGLELAEIATLPIILVLLIFAMGSFMASLMSWYLSVGTLCLSLGLIMAFSTGFNMSNVTANAASMLGVGLSIDYSLLIVRRFMELRKTFPRVHVTFLLKRTFQTSGKTVLFSSLLLWLSSLGGLGFHQYYLSSMCLSFIITVFCASLGASTFLLAQMAILDEQLFRWPAPRIFPCLFVFSGALTLQDKVSDEQGARPGSGESGWALASSTEPPPDVESSPEPVPGPEPEPEDEGQPRHENEVVVIAPEDITDISEPGSDSVRIAVSTSAKRFSLSNTPSMIAEAEAEAGTGAKAGVEAGTDAEAGAGGQRMPGQEEESKAADSRDSSPRDLEHLKEPEPVLDGSWHRVALFVTQNPWPCFLVSLAFLVGWSAYFFKAVRFGIIDGDVLSPAFESRQAQHVLHSSFSRLGQTRAYVFLETKAPYKVTDAAFLSSLSGLVTQLQSTAGVANVLSMVSLGSSSGLSSLAQYQALYANPSSSTKAAQLVSSLFYPLRLTDLETNTYVDVAISDAECGDRAYAVVRRIRALINDRSESALFPASSGMLELWGVGGYPAVCLDTNTDLLTMLPLWLCILFGGTFLVMLMMTRSIIVPAKTMFVAALSLTATLGIMLAMFPMQSDPAFAKALSFAPTGYIDAGNVIFIFSVSFGLTVDYQVFIIGRVLEELKNTKNNVDAIVRAVALTGPLITSAAVMLSIVVFAFIGSNVLLIKEIGVGIAVSVIIDAFLVRVLLVPSFLIIMGGNMLYCPAWLTKVLSWFGISEEMDPIPDNLAAEEFKAIEARSQMLDEPLSLVLPSTARAP